MLRFTFALCLLAWPMHGQPSSRIETLLLQTDEHLIATELLLSRTGSSLDVIDSIWTEREASLQQTETRLDERESGLLSKESNLESRETQLKQRDARLRQREQAIEKRSSSIDAREVRVQRTEKLLKAAPWVAGGLFVLGVVTGVGLAQ